MKSAFVFSGQGAQIVGMGKDFYQTHQPSKKLFQKANEILGFDLTEICFEGPQERLNETDICQPALLVMGLASLEYFKSKKNIDKLNVIVSAGLSLGEYTALVFAEALSFEDAVYIVKKRGEFMHQACQRQKSGMVSIIGLEKQKVERACIEASKLGVVNIANLNCPGQIVISGAEEPLKEASRLCQLYGAKRTIPLKVEGAYHSPLMKSAQDALKNELSKVKINKPKIPVVANSTAQLLFEPQQIIDELSRQITNPVLWQETIEQMIKIKVDTFYEFGPQGILTGLAKKIAPSCSFFCINAVESLRGVPD